MAGDPARHHDRARGVARPRRAVHRSQARGHPTALRHVRTDRLARQAARARHDHHGLAGYVGPGLIGLGAAWLLKLGYAVGLLWLLVALLALLLLQIRNWFGLWSILASGAALVFVTWFLDPAVQSAVAYAVTWFLLLGAVRPVFELQVQRSRGRARTSDADMLARLTGMPGIVWVLLFLLVTLGALALGGSWILGVAF